MLFVLWFFQFTWWKVNTNCIEKIIKNGFKRPKSLVNFWMCFFAVCCCCLSTSCCWLYLFCWSFKFSGDVVFCWRFFEFDFLFCFVVLFFPWIAYFWSRKLSFHHFCFVCFFFFFLFILFKFLVNTLQIYLSIFFVYKILIA